MGASLVRPLPTLGFPHWALRLYPHEMEQVGKNLQYDESLQLDDPMFLQLSPLLEQQKRKTADDQPLWEFTEKQFSQRCACPHV